MYECMNISYHDSINNEQRGLRSQTANQGGVSGAHYQTPPPDSINCPTVPDPDLIKYVVF